MNEHDDEAVGGQRPEPVEERPSVSEVGPEDYPEGKRAASNPNGAVDSRDALKPGEWDKTGGGELDSGEPSTVGADKG